MNVLTGAVTVATAVLLGTGSPASAGPPVAPPARADVIATTARTGDYWAANGVDRAALNSANATFHVGNLAAVTAGGVTNHVTLPWAQANAYALPHTGTGPLLPDDFAAGEAYLDLLAFHADTPLGAVRSAVAAETARVQAGHTGDVRDTAGLNMMLPTMVRLGVLDANDAEITAADHLYASARRRLFDERTGLWRGCSSLGNGWALAATVKLAAALPATDPRRAQFTRILRRTAAALRPLQRPDGLWNANLATGRHGSGPESAGTSFFLYALAWGVENGVLPAAIYRPVAEKAWHGLTTKALDASGRLGYVQTSRPGPVQATDTTAYGVGAFLIAGAELSHLES